jgi:hypothetical protein
VWKVWKAFLTGLSAGKHDHQNTHLLATGIVDRPANGAFGDWYMVYWCL